MRTLIRSLKIAWIFAYYRLDTFFTQPLMPWYVQLMFRLMLWRYFIPAQRPQAERLRLALEALGPVFIKFGQMLSTRRDSCPMIWQKSWRVCRTVCRPLQVRVRARL